MAEKRLEGKVIVISGGTSGVGKTAAEEFAAQGAKIVIGGRNEEAALRSLRTIRTYGSEGIFVHTELTNVKDCKKLFDEASAEYGRIDGFFNYAGVTPVSPLDTCDQATFDKVMDVNFIVLTGSPHAWGGEKDRAAYACSKGVLLTLMDHIAKNYGEDRIRCNYLTLGWTPTEGEVRLRISQGQTEAELRREASKVIPFGRMNERSDYIGALVYLMSDESYLLSGSIFRCTGGWYIGTSMQQ